MSADPDVERELAPHLAAVAGYGLPGSVTELPNSPLSPRDWGLFLPSVRWHRLDGLLAAAARDGAMPVTADQATEAADMWAAATARSARIERALRSVAHVLEQAGVELRVLGDSALTRLDYANPTVRGVDIAELLVHPPQRERAETALTAAGWQLASVGRSWARDGAALRLHWSPADAAWDSPTPLEVAGSTLPTVGREERLLHAGSRVAGSSSAAPRLGFLRDVAELGLHRRLDPPRTVALARRLRAEGALAEAIRATWAALRLADVVALSAWARSPGVNVPRGPRTVPEPRARWRAS